MLHYEIPRAKDLPPGTVYGAFERFLHELNRGTDARQRFIARIRALRPTDPERPQGQDPIALVYEEWPAPHSINDADCIRLRRLVGPEGFEPSTNGL
jgi:hypothetical protein